MWENNKHPVLSDSLIDELNIHDQVFSVEASLDSLIPWIKYITEIVDKKILVFGTGGGGTTVAMASNIGNGEIHGVDISEWAINTTKMRAQAYSVHDKVKLMLLKHSYPLPFDDESFDMVILADVIEHIVDERGKYIRNLFQKLKKDGIMVITGTPNLIYPYDFHTTRLLLIPWMPSELAYQYALFRGKCKKGDDLDYAGRRGTTYWHIKNWLNNKKRRFLFIPYAILEYFTGILSIPITAVMPYINHLFIRKI